MVDFRGKNNPFYGKKHSEESKRKMSEAHKGIPISEETKKKLSIIHKMKGIKPPSQKGKHRQFTEEHKRNLRASILKYYSTHVSHNKGKPLSEEHKQKLSIIRKKQGICPPSQKGKHWKLSKETRQKYSRIAKEIGRTPPSRRGTHHSEETKQKLRVARLTQVLSIKDTSIEIIMQNELKRRGLSFETHFPVLEICKPDIVFLNKKIIIQCDGDYWHSKTFNNGKTWERDRRQDIILKYYGWKVYRFWEHEINDNIVRCVDKIYSKLVSANR